MCPKWVANVMADDEGQKRRGWVSANLEETSGEEDWRMKREAREDAKRLRPQELHGTRFSYEAMSPPSDKDLKASEFEHGKEVDLAPATASPMECANVPPSQQ